MNDDAYNALVEECANCVPSSWLDPMLSGQNAVAKFEDGPAVERLLQEVAKRIRALKTAE